MRSTGVADPPEEGPSATEHPVLQVARGLVAFVFHRFLFAWGLLLLAVAVGVLTAAWAALAGREQSLLDRLTGHGTVQVLDTSVQVSSQSGPEVLMDPDRAVYHHDYRFEYLLELSYLPGRPARRYRTAPVAAFVDQPFWTVVASAPVFRTTGFRVKVDRRLQALLAKKGDGFDRFRASFDMPMHALAIEWVAESRNRQLPVRYDPGNPGDFLLQESFEAVTAAQSRGCSIVIGLLLGGFGAFILIFAVSLLTAGTAHVWVPRVLFCAILVSIPFASSSLQSAAAWLGLPELQLAFLREWTRSTDPRSRAGFFEEVSGTEATLVDMPVDLARSRDKDVYAFFTVTRDAGGYASFGEAMKAISAQVAGQMVTMPAADLFRFFKVLDTRMDQREEGWAEPLLEGARTIALDTTRSSNLRSWAISAFCDMAAATKDPTLAEAIYQQYVASEPDVRGYWRSFFADYAQAPSFADDLRSAESARIRRALEMWAGHGEFLDDVRPLVPRLKQLTTHSDPGIRKLALQKWNARTDWDERH